MAPVFAFSASLLLGFFCLHPARLSTLSGQSHTATNTPTSYGVGGLFQSITVNKQTGLVSGTPTAAGTHTLTLQAANAAGTGTKILTLTVTN